MAPVVKSRMHDFLYDSTFMVPTVKDFARHVKKATIISAKRDIAPVFDSMFSNFPHRPRQNIVLRKDPIITKNINDYWRDPKICGEPVISAAVPGGNTLKFFKSPIIRLSPGMATEPKHLPKMKLFRLDSAPKPRTRGTQTVYRESSAQTTPWKPKDYTIIDNSDPEILMIELLKEDLPPGMHEVEIIKRLRRKRGWLKQLPEMDTLAGVEKRRQILEALETDEWVFREQEIADLQNLRLDLVEKMLQEILDESNTRGQQKLERVSNRLEKKRSEKLAAMHLKHKRELRRLYRNHKGIILKYYEVNVITEHADFTSELYAPMTRFGSQPRNWHEREPYRYLPKLEDVEKMSTLPDWLPQDKIAEKPVILPGRRLCDRETKWSEPVLKALYRELKSMHTTQTFKCTLRKRIVKEDILDETGYFDTMGNTNKNGNEGILLLQSVIRGRATQSLIFEGRDKCRELIQELQCTHALVLANTDEINQKRFEVKNQQRIVQLFADKDANLAESLNKLKGTIVGTMLDYLNKEFIRLLDERKAHAIAMMYERDRRDREAAEAGRRQLENRRRQEHDEIFKQIVKVHQDTVDLYLNDIICEGVEHVSEETAKEYVNKIALKIDQEMPLAPDDFLGKEETIADMVCNFLIPEVEKSKIRESIRKKQKATLQTVHDSIYDKIEDLPNKRPDGTSNNDD